MIIPMYRCQWSPHSFLSLSPASICRGHEGVTYTMSKIHNGRSPSSTHWPGIQIFFFFFLFSFFRGLGWRGGKQCLAHTVLISDWFSNGMFVSPWSLGLSHGIVSQKPMGMGKGVAGWKVRGELWHETVLCVCSHHWRR